MCLIGWEVLRKMEERAWSLMKFLRRKHVAVLLLEFHHSRCFFVCVFATLSRKQDHVQSYSQGRGSIFTQGMLSVSKSWNQLPPLLWHLWSIFLLRRHLSSLKKKNYVLIVILGQ